VAEVVLIVPDAWDRTFTLREVVQFVRRVGRRSPDEELADWIQDLVDHLAELAWPRQGADT